MDDFIRSLERYLHLNKKGLKNFTKQTKKNTHTINVDSISVSLLVALDENLQGTNCIFIDLNSNFNAGNLIADFQI